MEVKVNLTTKSDTFSMYVIYQDEAGALIDTRLIVTVTTVSLVANAHSFSGQFAARPE